MTTSQILVTTAQVAANAKGRHRWVTFPDSLFPDTLRGIQRVRLSKLARLLDPRKALDVRWVLDEERGTLDVSWVNVMGRRGRIQFWFAGVPLREAYPRRPESSLPWKRPPA